MNTYTSLIGKHEGENAFVLGAGTSLYDLCVSYSFPEIFNHVVISINSSIMVTHWEEGDPDKRYFISNDSLCRRWSWWEKVLNSKCTKIVRDSWLKYKDELPGFLFFKPRPTSEGIIDSDDEGLAYCSSVPSGIDLAIQMGCKRIFVFGLDHNRCGDATHYWQLLWDKKDWPTQNRPAQQPYKGQEKVFEISNLAYAALESWAISKKVEIYSCSPTSSVKAFDKINFDQAKIIIEKGDKDE